MAIKEGVPNQHLGCEIRFTKPWKSTSAVTFDLAENGDQTPITWTMSGSLPLPMFWMKAMMETWVGMDYERGLRMLKEYCETGEILTDVQVGETKERHGFHYLGIKRTCSLDEIGPMMAADFEKLEAHIKEHELPFKDSAFSIYHDYNMKQGTCSYTSGVATPELIEVPDGFVAGRVSRGKALTVEHTGSYQNLGNAWSAGYATTRAQKLKLRSDTSPLEVYTHHPKMTEPKDLHTVFYFPIR